MRMYIFNFLLLIACAAAQCNTLFFSTCGLHCEAPAASQVVIPSSSQRNMDLPPSNANEFVTLFARGITAKATSGATSARFLLDGGAVGMGFRVRLSYDFTGDGTWDAMSLSPFMPTDGVIGQYEAFSYTFSGPTQDMTNGIIRAELWSTFPISSTGKLRTGTEQSTITIPYSVSSITKCGGVATAASTNSPKTSTPTSSSVPFTSSSVASTKAAPTTSSTPSTTSTSSSSTSSPATSTVPNPVVAPAPAPGVRPGVSTNSRWSTLYGSVVGDVSIASGLRVLMDIPSLKAGVITIQNGAALVFDSSQASIDVTAAAIVVLGEFWIGTESDPFQPPVNIILSGSTEVTVNSTVVGTKVVAVGNGGLLEWHGAKGLYNSWTTLSATALRGATRLYLSSPAADLTNPAGWRVGDDIVVAGTDYSPDQSEKVTITSVLGPNVIEVSPALSSYHHGTITKGVDERAEVGLLSRSIAVRSGPEGRIGAHIIFLAGSRAKVEAVQASGLGQDQIGRYPFHWHMAGDQQGSYIKYSSIHDSNFRCVTVHGAHNVLIESNVAFNSLGHCMYLEDGVERGNVFRNNLVANVREKINGERLGSDYGMAVSGFWITSPDNVYQGNAVSGSPGAGYWVHVRMGPRGLSALQEQYKNYRPNLANLKLFLDNKASGCDHGFQIEATYYDNWNVPQNGLPEAPMAAYSPKRANGQDDPVYLDGFTAHHNRFRGLWARAPIVYVRYGKFSNNMEGIQIATSGDHPAPGSIGYVEDTLIVGWTDNIGNNVFNNWQMWNHNRQRSWPRNGIPMVGVAYYDGPQVLRRITFDSWKVDENETPHSAVGTRFHGEFQVASTNQLADCTFNDVTYRSYVSDRNGDGGKAFNFRVPGATMGHPKGTVLTPWGFYDAPNCRKDKSLGLLCPQRYAQMWIIDFENRGGNHMTITRNEHLGSNHGDYSLTYRGFHSAGIWRYQPLVSIGASYLFSFTNGPSGSLAFQLNNAEKGEAVSIAICYPSGTTIKKVQMGFSNKLGGGLLPPINDPNNRPLSSVGSRSSAAAGEGYHHDTNRGLLFISVRQRSERADYANFCPDGGCDFVHVEASIPSGATTGDCYAAAYGGDSIQVTSGTWLNTNF